MQTKSQSDPGCFHGAGRSYPFTAEGRAGMLELPKKSIKGCFIRRAGFGSEVVSFGRVAVNRVYCGFVQGPVQGSRALSAGRRGARDALVALSGRATQRGSR